MSERRTDLRPMTPLDTPGRWLVRDIDRNRSENGFVVETFRTASGVWYRMLGNSDCWPAARMLDHFADMGVGGDGIAFELIQDVGAAPVVWNPPQGG